MDLDTALRRAAGGDRGAFEILVREHQAMVYSIAWQSLRDSGRAEEMAQDVFLMLFRKLETIESAPHLKNWLRKVTVNRAIDAARHGGMLRTTALEEVPEPRAAFSQSDPLLRGTLDRLVASLPAVSRMVLTLRYQEEMELADIAATLGMPLNTVKSTLHRTLGLLRGKLERKMGEVKA